MVAWAIQPSAISVSADPALYQLAREVEQVALRLLEEHRAGRNLQTNVEYYTTLLLNGLDLPTDLFTPTFALSRGRLARLLLRTTRHRPHHPPRVGVRWRHGPTMVRVAERRTAGANSPIVQSVNP